MTDTIYALASGAGPAGVAVIRVSGPAAGATLARLSGQPEAALAPRRARLRALRAPHDGEVLDHALTVWFPGPGSFTGEDVAEFHVHGGRAVVAGVTEALSRMPGLRPAEAGEFTRRAFEHGRLDLTAAEALADLVAAETAAQRRQALRQADGALARMYDGWRQRLVAMLAHLEAVIDFPDEELPADVERGIARGLAALEAEVAAHLADGHRGERLRSGVTVAIVGPPNAGKSSLLNRLAGRDAAIVAATAGTTRDVVEVHLELDGFPVVLADTAGLREAGDEVEREGVRRARARAGSADLVLAVIDGTAPEEGGRWAERLEAERPGDVLRVMNKGDLLAAAPEAAGAVSARTGTGLAALERRLGAEVARRLGGTGAAPALTRQRHRRRLEACRDALARARGAPEVELRAEDLRIAARELGAITGRVEVEEVLDVIFRDFCIGK